MEGSLSYQPYLDQLIAFASQESRKPDLIAAKQDYFNATGEVFEDDKTFEMRMASFLDHYLYERVSPLSGKTPAQEYFEFQREQATPDEAAALRAFTETTHGLFEIRKLGKGVIRMRELFSGKDFDVTERRQLAGLEKGDIIEARLIPYGGHLLFSGAFICHPKEACDVIRKEAKRLKKKVPDHDPRHFAWECSKMALKADRYRQIAVEKIYEFGPSKKL
jgi:hypothetical protein